MESVFQAPQITPKTMKIFGQSEVRVKYFGIIKKQKSNRDSEEKSQLSLGQIKIEAK